MKLSYFTRKIDELGRIVLPIEIRQNLDIKERDSLDISIKDNSILIHKKQAVCIFCNSTSNLTIFFNKNMCKSCIKKLKKGDFNE